MLQIGRVARRSAAGATLLILALALISVATFSMACGDDPPPTPVAEPAPAATPAPEPAESAPAPAPTPESEPANEDDALTRAYVEEAIERYKRDGLDATVAYYSSEESIEGERYLVLLDGDDGTVVAIPFFQDIALGVKHSSAGPFLERATEAGGWLEHRELHPTLTDTGVVVREDDLRTYFIRYDGWLFTSSHSILQENLAEATKDYVSRAIARYESEGLEGTVDYYNSQDSLEGRLYLFLIGADDNYLAHPIFPNLIGTDIKEVRDSGGDPLGQRIAQATEEGIWVEYLWPTPITRVESPKTTWAVRHDGLIFASGYYYYDVSDETEPPAWRDADPREYTVEYVERAIERYERDGLESMLNYYNSAASFEGEWYLFATDANDIYHVHPLLPRLIGTDIKDVVGSDGYELGKALAEATEEGVWVEYLWPHPVTLQEVPKVGYAVRHDGLLFASGYYPTVDDPAAYTKGYVQKAIDYYEREGVEATLAYYNSPASVDGSYWLMMVGPEGDIVASAVAPEWVGVEASTFTGILAGEPIGEELLGATEEGHWFQYVWPNPRASGVLVVNLWIIRHDGYVFASGHYEEE